MQPNVFVAVVLALALAGCGGLDPTAPRPVESVESTAPSPTGSPVPRLSGIVQDDEGRPVAGVVITAALGTSDETDEEGRFAITTSAPPGVNFGVWLNKQGYEYKHVFLPGPTAVITIHRTIRLPVGESLRITIGPDDSVGPLGEIDFYYRRVLVVSSAPTGVELRAVADDGEPVNWVVYGGPCCPSPPSVTTSIDEPGAEVGVEFRVPFGSRSSRTFTLITRPLGR